MLSKGELVSLYGIHAFHAMYSSFLHGLGRPDVCHWSSGVSLQKKFQGQQHNGNGYYSECNEQ